MSIAEAIQRLKVSVKFMQGFNTPADLEALKMGIRALERCREFDHVIDDISPSISREA